MLKIIGSDILAYRKVIEDRKNDLPIWERKVLTCEEAAAYSGIGNRLIRIENMNSLVSHLFDRSTALRFHQNVNNEIDKSD